MLWFAWTKGAGEACVGLSCVITAGLQQYAGALRPQDLGSTLASTLHALVFSYQALCPAVWAQHLPRALGGLEMDTRASERARGGGELPGDGWCGKGGARPKDRALGASEDEEASPFT